MSLNENIVIVGSEFCDLLVYDKYEKVFYEHFYNYDIHELKRYPDIDTTFYKILLLISAVISLIFNDFFMSLDTNIVNILFALSVLCGIVFGFIAVHFNAKHIQKIDETIIANSTYNKLELTSITSYMKKRNKLLIGLLLFNFSAFGLMVVILFFLYTMFSHFFSGFIFTIIIIPPFFLFLFSILPYKYFLFYFRLKKYQDSFFK